MQDRYYYRPQAWRPYELSHMEVQMAGADSYSHLLLYHEYYESVLVEHGQMWAPYENWSRSPYKRAITEWRREHRDRDPIAEARMPRAHQQRLRALDAQEWSWTRGHPIWVWSSRPGPLRGPRLPKEEPDDDVWGKPKFRWLNIKTWKGRKI